MSSGRPAGLKLGNIGSSELNAFLSAKHNNGNGGEGSENAEVKDDKNIINWQEIAKEKPTRAQEFFYESWVYVNTLLSGHKLFTPDTRPGITDLPKDNQLSETESQDLTDSELPTSSPSSDHHTVGLDIIKQVLARVANDFADTKSKNTASSLKNKSLDYLQEEWAKEFDVALLPEIKDYVKQAIDFAFVKLTPKVLPRKPELSEFSASDFETVRRSDEYQKLVESFLRRGSFEAIKLNSEQAAWNLMNVIFGRKLGPNEVNVFLRDVKKIGELMKSGKIDQLSKLGNESMAKPNNELELAKIREQIGKEIEQEENYLLDSAPQISKVEPPLAKPAPTSAQDAEKPRIETPKFIDQYGIEFTRELTSEEQGYANMLIKTGLEWCESQKNEWLKTHSEYAQQLANQGKDAFEEYVIASMRLQLPSYYKEIGLPVLEKGT